MNKSEKGYHKLIVWQRLKELLLITYRLIESLPKSEDFGLKSQMRRAIVSVLSNLVEGYLKKSTKEKLHFLEIAETSLLELEAQSEICLLLSYWNQNSYEEFEEKRSECSFLLYRYKSSIS